MQYLNSKNNLIYNMKNNLKNEYEKNKSINIIIPL